MTKLAVVCIFLIAGVLDSVYSESFWEEITEDETSHGSVTTPDPAGRERFDAFWNYFYHGRPGTINWHWSYNYTGINDPH